MWFSVNEIKNPSASSPRSRTERNGHGTAASTEALSGFSSHLPRIWYPGHELIEYTIAETIFKVYHLIECDYGLMKVVLWPTGLLVEFVSSSFSETRRSPGWLLRGVDALSCYSVIH